MAAGERKAWSLGAGISEKCTDLVFDLSRDPFGVDGRPPAHRVEQDVVVMQIAVEKPRLPLCVRQSRELMERAFDEATRKRLVATVKVAREAAPPVMNRRRGSRGDRVRRPHARDERRDYLDRRVVVLTGNR